MAGNKTYTNAELNALVAEFSAEFDALVKSEVNRSGARPLRKDDEEQPPAGVSADGGSGSASGSAPGESAPASAGGDPMASAGGDPAASAGGDPMADAGASAGGDPVEALKAAYAQLAPEELQAHFIALKEVLMAQTAGGSAGGDPMASAGGDPMASAGGDPAASAGIDPMASAGGMPPAGPDAVAPLAGEGSKPIDPAATMTLKSEFNRQINLVKSERDAKIAELQKSVEMLTEAMTKAFSAPVRKGFTAKDLVKTESGGGVSVSQLSKTEVTKRLLTKARDPKLQKSDRDLINNFYKGAVKVDALAHLLG